MWQQVGRMPGRTADLVPERCALADVIQEAPHLMTLLQLESRRALSGCNKQLRAVMHSCVTAIGIDEPSDLAHIVKGDWPRLVVIVLRKEHVWDLRWPCNGNVQLVARFAVGENDRYHAAFFVSAVQKQQQPLAVVTASPLYLSSTGANADYCAIRSKHGRVIWSGRRVPEWRNLGFLLLAKSQLSCAAIGCLLRGCPVHLHWLDLNHNDVRAAGVELLVAAHLPNLYSLSLDNTELDAAALQHLVTGKWPELRLLSLDGNQLNDMAVECLHSSAWPKLTSLWLNYNAFGALGVHHVTCGRWPLLHRLALDFAAIDATVLALLSIPCDALPPVQERIVLVTCQTVDHSPGQPVLWPRLKVIQFN